MEAFGPAPPFRREIRHEITPDVFPAAVPNKGLAGKARYALFSKELLWYKTRHIPGALRHILVDPSPNCIKGDQRQRSRLAPSVEEIPPEPMCYAVCAGVNWGADILRDCLPSVDGTMLHDLGEDGMRRGMKLLDDCAVFTEMLKHLVSYRRALLWERAHENLTELCPMVRLHLPLGSSLGLLNERGCGQQPEREVLWQSMLRFLSTVVEVRQVACERHRLAGSGSQKEF